jgi:diguanylate cyclase (GGDEF)-like protein
MTGTYNPWLVCLSVIVAILVSYTALNLAVRVSSASRSSASLWLGGGAVAMGGGIWSMHFIGMLAFSLPIPLSYDIATTLASLAIAIFISGFALWIAARPHTSLTGLAVSAVVMGLGICAMHYSGMSAIQILPVIRYERAPLLASIGIAIGASFAALWLFVRLRAGDTARAQLMTVGAAIVMGFAISGMHYTGMAASQFAPGSYCLTGSGANSSWLAATIALVAFGALSLTLVLLFYDAHLTRSRAHATQLQRANEQLQHVATHDALTGLPNRVLLADRLEQAIAQAERGGGSFALLMVDLDRFKSINDSIGHQAGDELLKEVAQRLKSILRQIDTLARLGGDEFVIIVNCIAGPQHAESVIGDVLECIGQPMKLASIEVQTSPSIGVSLYPHDGTDPQTLLKHADAAMYHAKKMGRNTFQFFAAEMNAFTRERLELEGSLRTALCRREFVLHYQPKVDIKNGHIVGVEALIRWNHPKLGLLPPEEFIPLAEETGLIVPIGDWVLYEACRQAHAWHAAGITHLRMAVNLAAQQFRQANLVETVGGALAESALEARFLELELTETAVMQDAEESASILQRLSSIGVRLSLDDFGTGYSSLSYLQRFPLNKVKIDRSFVREIARSEGNAEIVRAIVSLAHSLRLSVIAEGVETVEQLDFLAKIGCDQYQGYYRSSALPADALEAMVRSELSTTSRHHVDWSAETLISRIPRFIRQRG